VKFPKFGCEMERLRVLRLEYIAIKELPSLPGHSDLTVSDCENLIHLPNIEEISAGRCVSLKSFPQISRRKSIQYKSVASVTVD
jgi:hypothetical protein